MSGPGSRYSELWVCFVPPPVDPPAHVMILSFMSPGEEEATQAYLGSQFVGGRDVARQVHAAAHRIYIDLIARIGATPCVNGKSLRQLLKGRDGYSRWWFHKVSEKDCGWDDDPTYLTLIRLLCVQRVADDHGIATVRVYGGTAEFTAVVTRSPRGFFRVGLSTARALAYGVLSRLVLLKFHLHLWWILRRVDTPSRAEDKLDLVLEAHWDWSLRPDRDGNLADRYFRDLPGRLQREGVRIGWLAWCEPYTELWQRGRRLRAVVTASLAHPQVVLLERYLRLWDILSTALNFRYLLAFFRCAASPIFRQLFRDDDFDLFPGMRPLLIRGFADSCIPRRELVLQAAARATRHLRPEILVTFLELFLHTRAMYAGARIGSKVIQTWTAQHGAYCSDKTIGVFDPVIEFAGKPDGCGIMAPDRIYVMGELARRIWTKSGFCPDQVIVAGGLRYQHVRAVRARGESRKAQISVLLVCAMTEAWDLEMCEAATLASEGLPIRLRFRDHPSYSLSERRGFARFRTRIEVTTGSVDEDLEGADLVLFTYSGMAEEALLRGIPVWQWRWAGVNPTVFGDLPVIPTFTSVRALREALQAFVHDPEPFRPTPGVQETVLRACFGPAPAQASARIAEDITGYIRGPGVLTSGSAKAREQ